GGDAVDGGDRVPRRLLEDRARQVAGPRRSVEAGRSGILRAGAGPRVAAVAARAEPAAGLDAGAALQVPVAPVLALGVRAVRHVRRHGKFERRYPQGWARWACDGADRDRGRRVRNLRVRVRAL